MYRHVARLATPRARRCLFELLARRLRHAQSVRERPNRITVRGAPEASFERPNCGDTKAGAIGKLLLRVSGRVPLLPEKFGECGLTRHRGDFGGFGRRAPEGVLLPHNCDETTLAKDRSGIVRVRA